MTQEEEKDFLDLRSQTLAFVVLTRRDDLTVTAAPPESALDLTVTIRRPRKRKRPSLGILVTGTFDTTEIEWAKARAEASRRFRRLKKATYPVCWIHFAMWEDRGFIGWLAEPRVTAGGGPRLVRVKPGDCEELTNDRVADIVTRVVAWYDAREAALVGD